ncbi:CHC2 zinc finger domain-containing protein [Agriterribacter sp.]|uniref:CHC2 zinc finger domain-containing protein n=1 Tax=Agriterribacter sp. TaxID=2821509 RepID=UPI002C5C25DD|nr:CHC2 zinc finger domain-containing protein [Agriterribacter sp.]HTN06662.1 CHC2 zinc finger domain-containing protein [Agriterribacter sp.]
MELKEIKQQLTINQVLSHYRLKPDKNHRLLCPFHPDKTPSLQIYPATNTYCCFSSNCHAGTGDAIQFIQLKENCNKHEALVKATALLNDNTITTVQPATAKLFIESAPLEKIAVVTKLFKYFAKALPLTKKGVDYLEGRAINYKQHEAGYNSGDWHHKLNELHFLKRCEQYGLLKSKPAGGYSVWAKECIIFPLKNQEEKIISLYGRSTTNDKEQRHFYLQNREGLYPGYPALTTKQLILTESIIDAASLLQQQTITEQYTVLSLYGTNGLTEEHTKAITALPQLEEIIFMLDADEAGEAATAKHTVTLKQILPEVKISKVTLPSGEDINSVLQNHDDATVLQHLIDNRTDFLFSIENKKESAEATATAALAPLVKLDVTNAELLVYDNCQLRIEIWGGIKITGLDRMKVTLKVQHKTKQLLPIRDTLDLYSRNQTEQLIQTISESFDCNIKQTETTISELTNELENYRIKKIEALQPKQETKNELTAAQRQAAINELKKEKLLERHNKMIGLTGIVGEEKNRVIAYLVYTMRKQQNPLHVMFLGASGSGKTYLQEKISELIPDEDKMEITQITENALYYFKQEELKNKLIIFEDLDGALSVFYPMRELQTKKKISKTVTLKDSKGNLKTITIVVEGPVCISGCTTKEKLYEDNANRCILLYIDMSRDQDKKIMEYHAALESGDIDQEREQQYKELFKNIQRVLRPIQVNNPYSKFITLPEAVFKPRRTITLLRGFIKAIAFYHQYQREVKKDRHGQLYIDVTYEDIEQGFYYMKDVLFSKSDELTKATREFLEGLKQLSKQTGSDTFNAKAIREQLRMNPGNMKRYLAELVRYGYIKANGNRYRKGSYEYSIVKMDEYEALKSQIEQHLQGILQAIRQQSDTVKDHITKIISSSVVQ